MTAPSPTASAEEGPISNRRVLKIALPIVLSNATIPILGLVDTGVVGQIGTAEPIAAVGVGAAMITAIYWVFGFLRMGTVGLVGQALGANDRDEVSLLLTRALLIAGAAGITLILLQIPVIWGALRISPSPSDVEDLAHTYMAIRIWSAPAAIALYGVTGWLIAQERTRAVLVLQLWMNGLNIVLSLAFVLGLNWGIGGVAFATFLAEYSGLALGLWLCRDAFRNPVWRARLRVLDPDKLRHMALVNRDILIRSLLLQAIFLSFILLGGHFGATPQAANQILVQFLYVTAYALDGFAFAAEAIVARAMGAKRPVALRRGALLTSAWGTAIGAALTLTFWIAGPAIIDIMAKSPEVQQAARTYLPWMIAAPLLGVASWMLDGIFIGATRSRDMRNMMVLSAAIYFAALWPLMALYGNHGLWIALLLSFIARGITLGARYPALERAAAG
ncbi:MATE family efflux transporter [Aestuariibius sp. 2305UL40-4]|uniref:MATE family efflux transporter n=1 Tax=Aestuariibius violaceus TaxID=3234132 RepID=UPI00345E8F25